VTTLGTASVRRPRVPEYPYGFPNLLAYLGVDPKDVRDGQS